MSFPLAGTKWRHYKNGKIYTVFTLANLSAGENYIQFPVIVVYKDEEGKTWARQLSDWSGKFEKVEENEEKN